MNADEIDSIFSHNYKIMVHIYRLSDWEISIVDASPLVTFFRSRTEVAVHVNEVT